MENETESRSSRTESRIAWTLKIVLGLGLAASLVAGGRQVVAASARPNNGASNFIVAPPPQP